MLITIMNRCPQCQAEIPPGAQFCPACGLRVHGGTAPLAAHKRPWGGRKVVLWFLLAALILAAIFLAGVFYFIRHTTIVTTTKNGGRVESPFGVLSSSSNPAQLAHNLGLDIYPGATALQGTQVDLNNSIIVSLQFESSDPAARIISFYHVRYPDAAVKATKDGLRLVQLNPRDTLTIEALPDSHGTRIRVNDIRH
ncbi:MAG TPA: zinc ribbon domain-containing protein [Terriglobales bacterium]|nr:zinc ribbon domain-containing protein [Terriglobales bacterium]